MVYYRMRVAQLSGHSATIYRNALEWKICKAQTQRRSFFTCGQGSTVRDIIERFPPYIYMFKIYCHSKMFFQNNQIYTMEKTQRGKQNYNWICYRKIKVEFYRLGLCIIDASNSKRSCMRGHVIHKTSGSLYLMKKQYYKKSQFNNTVEIDL